MTVEYTIVKEVKDLDEAIDKMPKSSKITAIDDEKVLGLCDHCDKPVTENIHTRSGLMIHWVCP